MRRLLAVVTLIACSRAPEDPCRDPAACPIASRPDEVALAALQVRHGEALLELGDATGALALFQHAYDHTLALVGDRSVQLADHIDRLARANRARGKLRDALRLHDRSLALHRAALGNDAGDTAALMRKLDTRVVRPLIERGATKLEAGDIAGAREDLAHAGARIPSHGERTLFRQVAAASLEVEAAAGGAGALWALAQVEIDRIPPLAVGEPLTVTRSGALATRVSLLVTAGRTDEARRLTQELRARFVPGRDPRIAVAVASALVSVGDRAAAAALLARVAAALPDEPSRTALRVFTLLARTSDTQAAAAARAAIALYQAMPELDRSDHDEMWSISRR